MLILVRNSCDMVGLLKLIRNITHNQDEKKHADKSVVECDLELKLGFKEKDQSLDDFMWFFWRNMIQSKPAAETQVYKKAYTLFPSPKKRWRLGSAHPTLRHRMKKSGRNLLRDKKSLVPTILGVSLFLKIQWLSLRVIQNPVCKWQYRRYDVVREFPRGHRPDAKDL